MTKKSKNLTQEILDNNIETSIGKIPRINTQLSRQDHINNILARLGINRMNYQIKPGLYAIGSPTPDSTVLVTANYKLTIDKVRKNLEKIDTWLLVLDTRGINVWCAAGEGNFGTQELLNRIRKTELQKLISHRELILPQLSAPGVDCHKIKGLTDLNVKFGPVRIQDLPKYLKKGKKCNKEMRTVTFSLKDRLSVIPVEFKFLLKPLIIIFMFILGLDFLQHQHLTALTFRNYIPILGAALTGTVVFPITLPYLPSNSFALNGWLLGLIWAGIVCLLYPGSIISISSNFTLLPPITTYLALNFTGSTTYTNLSGVKKETQISLPLISISLITGLVLKFFIIF